MSEADWQEVEGILVCVMELQETERPARIHELCGDRAQPRKSQVVEMLVFGGLSAKDIATVLHTTEATVRRCSRPRELIELQRCAELFS